MAAHRLYARLIQMNGEFFGAEEYESAYHALMTAMHAAQDAGDAEGLDSVAGLATRQQAHLDGLTPAPRLATSESAGGTGVFSMAARQANMQAQLARQRGSPPRTG